MRIVTINGGIIRGREDLHNTLQAELELGTTYGKNLDALWDALTGWIQLPLTLVWLDFESSRTYLGDYADELLELLREAEQELDGFIFEIR